MNSPFFHNRRTADHSFPPVPPPHRMPGSGLEMPMALPHPPVLATIESIATGTPDYTVPQAAAARVVAQMSQLEQNRHRIATLYQHTRIETRHLALDLLMQEAIAFSRTASIQERMQRYRVCAVPLAERVVRQALATARAEFSPSPHAATLEETIRQIVFVSSTGFIAPGIDTELIQRLGLRRDMARLTVNFMGCAAAMNGLRAASDYVRSHPTHRALVVCLELSSVNAVFEDDVNDLIIHSIFGDGCAAVVIGACEEVDAIAHSKIVIRDHLSALVENTQDGITLGLKENGITCKLSRHLPDYIEAGVNPIIEGFLRNNGFTKDQIDLWAIHPGGTRIIEKAQRSLGLSDRQVVDSWEILRQYGNMLSASVLFVLERMLFQNRSEHQPIGEAHPHLGHPTMNPPLTGIAFSFSPGVGIEGILFQKL